MIRGMVNIGKDRVKLTTRFLMIKPVARGHGEEVALDQSATRVVSQSRSHWKDAAFVPLDNRCKIFDHLKVRDPWLGQNSLGRVAKTKTAHHDFKSAAPACRNPQATQGNFGGREMAGHQEILPQHDFPHIHTKPQIAAPAQAKGADRRGAIVYFLK